MSRTTLGGEKQWVNSLFHLARFRGGTSFHFDSDDKSTKAALKKLRLPRYDLMSGDSDKILDFYFDFADTIDVNYLIDKFKDGRPELRWSWRYSRLSPT